MRPSVRSLNPSEAARRLGVSTKALRLYEDRGLVAPERTAAGWRAYGPAAMARAAQVVALRALGLSLAQVADVLDGERGALEPALAVHQAALEAEHRQLGATIERVRGVRAALARGRAPSPGDLTALVAPVTGPSVRFALPWPWGGEPFELHDLRPLTYIVGPLGSGKTQLARCVAAALPGAVFLGLDRLADDGAAGRARLAASADLEARVAPALAWLIGDGASASGALLALLVGLAVDGPTAVVVDMVEQELDRATQRALIAYLRQRAVVDARPLFLMTRSAAILDLDAVGPRETLILCPANHSPPTSVVPVPGAAGYEAIATCLATPEVRARTHGVVASRPATA